MPPLYVETLYLALGAARIQTGQYSTRGRWTAAAAAWIQSRREGSELPVVFGDAQFDSGHLIYRARVDSLEVNDDGTHLRFSHLAPLVDCDVTALIKVSDGTPMRRDRRRGYSMVRTPEFSQRVWTSGGEAAAVSHSAGEVVRFAISGGYNGDVLEGDDIERRLQIVRRQQSAFRSMVERAWGHRCAITGTGVRQVLQAAHLRPYSETRDNRAENGILLRMDLHALWDEHLLGIDPVTQRVRLAACLAKTGYKALEGKPLRTRTDGLHLDAHGLQMRWERFLKCAGGVRED